jgi:hypothetical protein
MHVVLKIMRLNSINLKKLVIQTLFMWKVTLQSMSECSYSYFSDLCSSFSLN